MELSQLERSDLTSLTNTLAGGANTLIALLPIILLFKGAFILGITSLLGATLELYVVF